MEGHHSPELTPMKQAERLIRDDSKDLFVHFLKNQLEKSNGSSSFQQSELLKLVCTHCAVGCATALVEGETGLTVDVNVTWEDGLSPLHLAAQNLSYGLTQLLLHHGSNPNPSKDLSALPLSMALKALRDRPYVADWGPGKSVYKLIYVLSLLELKEPLNTIKLLVSKTEDLQEISFYFIKQREVAQFAALLMVAWDKLVAPFISNGVEGSAIGEHLWRQIETINNRELEVMIACRPSCECLPVLKNKKTNLIAQWKLLKILEKGLDVIESFRNSCISELEKKYDVSYSLAYDLFCAGLVLHPDDVHCDDIECLLPKLKKGDKDCLNKAIEEKLRSASGLTAAAGEQNNFIHQMEGVCHRSLYMSPLFIYGDFEDDVDISQLTSWQLIKHALRRDNKDQFVELINSSTCEEDDYPTLTREIFCMDSVDCAAAVLDGETAGMLNLTTDLPVVGSNAFLEAARSCAPRITALLLERGFIADVPVSEDSNLMRKALTLALRRTRCAYRDWDVVGSNSAVKLVTILCEVQMRRFLETLRLLAYSTKETKHAFINCLKEGKMFEIGALLLVASEFLLSSSTFEEDGFSLRNLAESRHILSANKPSSSDESKNEVMEVEEVLKMLEIFDKIGDKLAAYVRLDNARFPSDDELSYFPVSFEIASLLEDAGFHVSVEDTYDHSRFRDLTRTYGPTILQSAPIGGCDNKIHDAHMLPSWWMRNRELPTICGKSDNCSHLSRRLFSTTPLNRKWACLAPTKRLTNGVRCSSSQIQFASVVEVLKKGLRHV